MTENKRPHTLGDAPIQEQYREKMNQLAGVIDRYFNGSLTGSDRQTGFVLLLFPFDELRGEHRDQPRCNFISNGANREDIVCLFREMIARFSGQPEVSGTA